MPIGAQNLHNLRTTVSPSIVLQFIEVHLSQLNHVWARARQLAMLGDSHKYAAAIPTRCLQELAASLLFSLLTIFAGASSTSSEQS